VQITVLRDVNNKLERHTVSVALGERPPLNDVKPKPSPTDVTPKKPAPAVIRPVLGVKLSELTNVLANEKNLRGVRGLLVTEVDPGGLAADAGLREDYVIERVNRVPVTALADFERVINGLKPGDAVVMQISYLANGRITKGLVQFTYQ
jgi:serine protease Do